MMTNKSTSLRFLVRMSVFALALFSVGALLSRCGGDDSKKSGASGEFTYSYGGSYERGSGAALTATTVNFTLSWREDGGKITGLYRDDYFAELAVQVTGVVQNGMRIMTIVFAEEKDGIAKLSITTAAVEGDLGSSLSISNLLALGSASNTVFEKNGLVMSKNTGGSGPGGSAGGNSGVFFSEVAGEYDFYAKNTNAVGNKTTWTHGNKYKIVITADGKVTIPTDGEPKVYQFGTSAEDVYEKYDHEEYVIMHPEDGVKSLVQRHFEPKGMHISWEIKDGAFWSFKETEAGPVPNIYTDSGLDYVVGTHTYKITFVSGENATDYKTGDPVEVTLADDGKITGTFGEYTFVKGDSSAAESTVNGKSQGNMTIYKPNSKTFPRWSLQLRFEDKKFAQVSAIYEESLSNAGRKAYHAVVGK